MKKTTLKAKQLKGTGKQFPISWRQSRFLFLTIILILYLTMECIWKEHSFLFAWESDEEQKVYYVTNDLLDSSETQLMPEPLPEPNSESGLFARIFSNRVWGQVPFYRDQTLYRGQTIYRGQTWGNPYSPTYVAQAGDVAATAPSLSGGTGGSSSTISSTPPGTIVPTSPASTAPNLDPTPSTGSSPLSDTLSPSVNKLTRLCNKASFEYTFIPRGSHLDGTQISEIDLAFKFAIPASCLSCSSLGNSEAGFYIAPKLSMDCWSGDFTYYWREDMPKTTFDVGSDFGFNGQYGDFGVDAFVNIGLASSFKKISSKALYLRGRAMGTLAVTGNNEFVATAGIIYYDRNNLKLLPSGGVIWTPNPQNVWRLVFPDPYIGRHLGKFNNTDWWGYISGDIGGGRWLIDSYGDLINVDYNDYRVGLGISFTTQCSVKGNFEVGGVFGREFYSEGHSWFKPNSAVYLKAGISY